MADPYLLVKGEVETSLQNALALYASLQRIRKTLPPTAHSGSEELQYAQDELRATLIALQGDLGELQRSVDVVARDPRFGIGRDELDNRRAFIGRIKDEMTNMRRSVHVARSDKEPVGYRATFPPQQYPNPDHASSSARTKQYANDSDDDNDSQDDLDGDVHRAHAAQQQSFMIESQDRVLEGISSTVSTLKAQAGTMGREILDQVGMLENLESGVDRSQSRLGRANERMRDFIRENAKSGSSWTILLLAIVLTILLFLIIAV